ncbi:Flavoredoxin [bacterium YEK0313]|nr:Flavoredoxin [bacterium YEK0313]
MQTTAAAARASKSLDIRDLSWAEQYKLMGGLVYPRPIGLVSTLGPSGPNAAPFSFFNAIAVDPPMLMFSIGPKAGAQKDTLVNIRHCPEFVIHLVSDAIKEQMNVCAGEHPAHVDEMALAGFSTVPSEQVRPPRIAEAPVAFECRLERIVELGRTPYYLVIGEAVLIHAHEGIISERYHVDADALDLVGRIAGAGVYVKTHDRFVMPLPSL